MNEKINLNEHGNGNPFDVLVIPAGQALPGTGEVPYIPGGPVGQPEPPKHPVKPSTPELDKQSPIVNSDLHKGLVAFLEWLESPDSGDLMLVRWGGDSDMNPEVIYDFQKLLARYYGLDLDKIEAEKMALIDYLRELNQQ